MTLPQLISLDPPLDVNVRNFSAFIRDILNEMKTYRSIEGLGVHNRPTLRVGQCVLVRYMRILLAQSIITDVRAAWLCCAF